MDVRVVEGKYRSLCAVRLGGGSEREQELIAQAGFGRSLALQNSYVIVVDAVDLSAQFSYGRWPTSEGSQVHLRIVDLWDTLPVLPSGSLKVFELRLFESADVSVCLAMRALSFDGPLDSWSIPRYLFVSLPSMEVFMADRVAPAQVDFYVCSEYVKRTWDERNSGDVIDISEVLNVGAG